MKKLYFDNVKTYILFGGGRVLRYLALKLRENEFKIFVFTSDRLVEKTVDGVPLEDFLEQNNIEYEVTANINSNKTIKNLATCDSLGISFGAPWIFKKELIDLFNSRLLNSHARNLPRNRGGGGFSWLILNNERESSSLLHIIDTGIDSGDIIKRKDYTFPDSCKIPIDYESYAFEMDRLFFDEFVDDIINKRTFNLVKQNSNESTYFPRLHSLTQGLIDWELDRDDIIRFIRAFDDPYCGALTYLKDKRVFLKKCEAAVEGDRFHPFLSGLVYRKIDSGVFIVTKTGGIVVSEVIDEDGNLMIDEIREGQRLFTPALDLEKAKTFHPVYTSKGLKQKNNDSI